MTTQKELESLVDCLNDLTRHNREAYTPDASTGHLNANIGTYTLNGAYGGWKLSQIVTAGGGERDLLSTGYTTKRELAQAIRAFIAGIELKLA